MIEGFIFLTLLDEAQRRYQDIEFNMMHITMEDFDVMSMHNMLQG